MKIVKSLEDSGQLLKGITKTIKDKTNEQKSGFLSMLLGTLGVTLLKNILSHKGVIRDGNGMKKERIFNVTSSFE